MSFQMGKQHLDFLTSSSALVIGRCVLQITNYLAGIFIHVPSDNSEWCIRACFANRTRAAGFLAGKVAIDALILFDPAQRHLMAFEASEAVAVCIILEMTKVVFALGLMFAIQLPECAA